MKEVYCAFFGEKEKADLLCQQISQLGKWKIYMDHEETQEKFLASLEKGNFSILWLDTSLDWMSVMKEIRSRGSSIPVVLLTMEYENAVKGYEFQVFRCLKEPVSLEKIEEVLENYEQHKTDRKILFRSGKNQFVNIGVNQIYYATIQDRGCSLYFLEEKIWVSTHLSELERQLPTQFCRCHNSFLVNLDMVKKICRYSVTLIDGREVPVSKQKYNAVKERLWFH